MAATWASLSRRGGCSSTMSLYSVSSKVTTSCVGETGVVAAELRSPTDVRPSLELRACTCVTEESERERTFGCVRVPRRSFVRRSDRARRRTPCQRRRGRPRREGESSSAKCLVASDTRTAGASGAARRRMHGAAFAFFKRGRCERSSQRSPSRAPGEQVAFFQGVAPGKSINSARAAAATAGRWPHG